MTDFINIIKFIGEKNNTYISHTLLDILKKYCIKNNNISDCYLYKIYILNNILFDENENISNEKMYIVSKKLKNFFIKYLNKRRRKKKKIYDIDTDLYFKPLNKYPIYQTINIIENNTIYKFRISDIINIWLDALQHNDDLFAKPIKLKNPYTNIPFKKYNLYNIYISIYFSNFTIPSLIQFLCKKDFNLDTFLYEYYPIIKDYIIENYTKTASNYDIYEHILNMMEKNKKDLNNIYIPVYVSIYNKKKIIKDLSPFLTSYLLSEYSCNPFKKKINKKKTIRFLNKFFQDNDVSYIRHEILNDIDDITTEPLLSIAYQSPSSEPAPPNTPPPPPPPSSVPLPPPSRYSSIRYMPPPINISDINPRTIELPPPPPPTTLPIRYNNNISYTTRYRIDRMRRETRDSIFSPNIEIPRTPVNLDRTTNSNIRPYSLNLFNRT
jgi:hypothetical protein